MGNIRILIVDDDKLLVNKMEETVDWEAIGISMVYTANNILQAKKLLEEFPIQILLCDIDMPQGNGLELLEWVRLQNLDIECVFLSSYANFAYAQKALSLSSKEYLLKPISNRELERSLKSIVSLLHEKNKNVPAMQDDTLEQFWENFIFCGAENNNILKTGTEGVIYGEEETFSPCMIKMFDLSSKESFKKELSHFNYVIHHIATDFLYDLGCNPEVSIHMGDFERLFVFRSRPHDLALKEVVFQIKAHLDTVLPHPCCVYLGKPRRLAEFAEAQERMEHMVKYAVLDETGIVLEEKWDFGPWEYKMPPWEAWLKEIQEGDNLEQTSLEIQRFIRQQIRGKQWNVSNQTRFVRELNQMLYHYLKSQRIRFEKLFDNDEYEDYAAKAGISQEGMQRFITYLFEKLIGNQQSDTRKEHVVQQLKAYIEEHLKEDLSRKLLSEQVYLSEVYISKLFASETGMSIPGYIAARRIERAKEYLVHSALSVSKIAIEVGYSNFSYFSKTFRELVGCTPNEYRNQQSGVR